MNEHPDGHPQRSASGRALPRWRRGIRSAEESLVVAVLAGMVLLPTADMVLRKVMGLGIKASAPFVQHCTLLVGMLGSALAAREDRLLALSSLTAFLKGRWQAAAKIIGGGFAASVSALLALASWYYVQVARLQPGSPELAYGVRIWMLQMLLPIGFAAVAWRLVWRSGVCWVTRGLTALLALALVWLILQSEVGLERLFVPDLKYGSLYGLLRTMPIDPAKFVIPGLIVLGLATVLGAPIFTTLGGAALILFWGGGQTLTLLALNHYDLVTDPILPSIPLFTLTGYFLAEGGASRRLMRLCQAAVGWVRGGPAIMTIVVCAFFTSFTGASGVTIIALGGLLMPVLLAAKYSPKTALGLLTGAGSMGLLFPPCLPLILYAIIAQRTLTYLEPPPGTSMPEVGIKELFLAGIGPGLLLVLLTSLWAVWQAPKAREARAAFGGKELGRALWDAKWELLLPVGAVALILGGLATPVETAAATALYAFLVETVVHRDLHLIRDVPRVMTDCGLLVGGVLLILGMAMGLTHYLIFADVPNLMVTWLQQGIRSPLVFLLLLNVFLLGVGCLMDIFSAIIVVVPLIVPLGLVYGVDSVHLGIIFLANLQLGYLTPPVGMNLFLASYRFNKPVMEVVRASLPMLVVLLIGVLLITYFPPLTTLLPRLLK